MYFLQQSMPHCVEMMEGCWELEIECLSDMTLSSQLSGSPHTLKVKTIAEGDAYLTSPHLLHFLMTM